MQTILLNKKSTNADYNQMMQALGGKKLGFGSLHLKKIAEHEVNRMFDLFLSSGFNFFEASPAYDNEAIFRRCLVNRHKRVDYLLADKIPIRNSGTYNKERFMDVFNTSLKNCGVEYFDFYLLHNVGRIEYHNFKDVDCFDYLVELKRKGLAKFVGFSFHDTADILEEILSKHHNKLDFVYLQINYADWKSPVIQSEKCLEVAIKYNIPVFAMTPLKGGLLLDLPVDATNIISLQKDKSALTSLAYRFAASQDGVVLVLSGMQSVNEVYANTTIMQDFQPLSKNEQNAIKNIREILYSKNLYQCTGCEYCLKVCKQNIPIPKLIDLINNEQRVASLLYMRLCEQHGSAGDCKKCGMCENVCPQKIKIQKALERAFIKYEKQRSFISRVIGKMMHMLGTRNKYL